MGFFFFFQGSSILISTVVILVFLVCLIVWFLFCHNRDKILWQRRVKGEKAFFASQFQVTVHHTGELTAQELEGGAGPITLTVKNREQSVQACLLVLS